MRKILVAICIIFSCVAYADTTLTSKNYVDNAVATKQDIVPQKNTNTVLTHTGESGNIGEKEIYDTTDNFAAQQHDLITAGVADAAIQNAVDTEFVCVEWHENDEHTDENCLGWQIKSLYNPSPNLLNETAYRSGASFDSQTAIMTNTVTDTKTRVNLGILTMLEANWSSNYTVIHQSIFPEGELLKKTFTANADANYIMIKHNGSARDFRVYFKIEPLTTYTVLVKCLKNNPTVVGETKMQLMLVKGEYNSNDIIPYGSVYIPQSQ